jgi:RNA polymerase sporulation-specific sigma factor
MSLAVLLAILFGAVPSLWMLAGYIGGNAFPKPLGSVEEAAALEAMSRGDETARARLIEHNLRLVAHVVKKFDNTGEDGDDLISIGTVGLIKAIDTFNPLKNVRLATYAARCIENEILMHLRLLKKTRGEVSLYDPVGVDHEGNEITLFDILGTDADEVPDTVAQRLQVTALSQYLSTLDPKERRVVEERFGLGRDHTRTQREIAQALGISRSYVSRIEKRAVRKLLQDLDPDQVDRLLR